MRLPETSIRKKDLNVDQLAWEPVPGVVCACGAKAISESAEFLVCGQCGRLWDVETGTVCAHVGKWDEQDNAG